MSNIHLICEVCNKDFERSLAQYKYQTKKGRKTFCSNSCGTRYSNTHRINPSDNRFDISKHAGNKRDGFTGFREFVSRIKKRAKDNSKFECKVTLQDLKDTWDEQQGVCPYTGLSLLLPNVADYSKNKLAKASLDRIDSSKGYEVGNIQYVSAYINYMKNDLTQSEFDALLKLIKERI
jgi:hypothetical protein